MNQEEQLPFEGEIVTAERKRLPGKWICAIIAGCLVICCGVLCALSALCTTAFPNVTVLGTAVGGMNKEEIESLWQKQGKKVCDETTVLLERLDARESPGTVSYTDLGISVTPEEASRSAMAVGRSGNFVSNTVTFVKSWFSAMEAFPALTVDETTLSQQVDELVATVDNTVVEGRAELDQDGADGPGLYITKPKAGERIDGAALRAELGTKIEGRSLHTLSCTYEQVTPDALDAGALYEEFHGAVAEARYDKASGKISRSRVGVDFDVDAMQKQIDGEADGATFLADAEVTFPKASTEVLTEGLFRDVLGTCTTTVTGTSSRIRNVYLAAKKIDGHIYNPGETFWYNATVGQRTEAAGFGPAPSYVGGETVDSIGGGICQVSSTLYYAALRADMTIVMRYCHQFVPGYILWGCDATVSWGGCDFAFRNASPYPIKIVTEWSDDNQLTVTLMGTKTDDGYVEMVNQVLSSTDWHTRYVADEEMQPGEEPKEIQTPYTGYFVKTYRNYYAADGTLLSSKFEASSDYESRDRIYAVSRQDYDAMVTAGTIPS